MTEIKEMPAFVLIEFLRHNDYEASYLGTKDVEYSNGVSKILFDKNEYMLPFTKLSDILSSVGFTYDDFVDFCKDFLNSPDFDLAMKSSIIKRTE